MNDKFPDLHAQAVTLISKEMGMDEKSIHKALRRYEYGASNLSAYSRQLVAHVQCLTKLLLTEKALARRDDELQEAWKESAKINEAAHDVLRRHAVCSGDCGEQQCSFYVLKALLQKETK